jgi:hypothetical protein
MASNLVKRSGFHLTFDKNLFYNLYILYSYAEVGMVDRMRSTLLLTIGGIGIGSPTDKGGSCFGSRNGKMVQ